MKNVIIVEKTLTGKVICYEYTKSGRNRARYEILSNIKSLIGDDWSISITDETGNKVVLTEDYLTSIEFSIMIDIISYCVPLTSEWYIVPVTT